MSQPQGWQTLQPRRTGFAGVPAPPRVSCTVPTSEGIHNEGRVSVIGSL